MIDPTTDERVAELIGAVRRGPLNAATGPLGFDLFVKLWRDRILPTIAALQTERDEALARVKELEASAADYLSKSSVYAVGIKAQDRLSSLLEDSAKLARGEDRE